MRAIKSTILILWAVAIIYATPSNAAVPVIISQPQSAAVIPGTNVSFSVAVAGELPSVSSGTLKLWLKGDAGVIISQSNRVSQWQDQSGANHHSFQANSNKQPLLVNSAVNGQPIMRFDGFQSTNTGDFLQGADDLGLTAGYTSFMVYSKVNRGGSVEEVPVAVGVPGETNAIRSFYFLGNQFSFAGWGNDYSSGFSVPTSTYRIGMQRMNTTKTQIDFFDANATNELSSSRTSSGLLSPSSGYYVGGLGTYVRNFQGDIAELIYYQGNLTESDRQLVATYLKQKYFGTYSTNSLGITYQWQFNGTNIVGATNALLTVTNAQTANNGSYSVIVSNLTDSVVSSSAVLTVMTPVTITSQPEGQTVVAGSNVVFNVSVLGDGPLFYQWKLNGLNITGETTSALTIANVQATNVGSYSVTISNAASAVTSSSAVLWVLSQPVITSQPQSASILAGTNVTFSVGAQGAIALPALSSGTLKLWLKADAGVILQSNRVSQWQDQSGGNRHSFQTDTNKQPSLVSGAVNGQATIRFDGVLSTSQGDYLQGTNDLGLTAGFTSFMVYSKINRVTPVEETPAVVGVPGINNAFRGYYCFGNEMAFSGWANDYFSGFTIPSSTYRIWTQRLNSGKTQVDFFDTNGTNDYTASRTTSGLLSPGAGYYVGGLGSQMRNFQGDVAELIYYQGALTESDRQLVAIYLKEKYFGPGNTGQGISYQWQLNGTNLVGATNAVLTLTNAQSADAGNYSVILSNAVGTVTSSNAVLTVMTPVTITSQPEGQIVVAGSNVVFNVSVLGDGPLFYQWKLNGLKITGETASALTITNVQATNVGSYSVTISNAVSAVTSSNAVLSILFPPVITSQPQSASILAGTNVTFSVGAQGASALPTLSSGTLKLWLKADAGVILQSNRVSQWQDQSGGNRHSFQTDPNKQPSLVNGAVNGQATLRFDGILSATQGDYLQSTNDLGLTAGFTSFMVYSKINRATPVEETPAVVGIPGNTSSIRGLYCFGNEMAFSAWGNDYFSGFTIPSSTYRIWTQRLNSSKTQLDFFDTNGTNDFTASRTTSSLLSPGAGYYVGGLGSQMRNFQGDIAELIYYQGALSESDRQLVATYLQQKYFGSGNSIEGISYQWQFNGTNIVGATNAFLTLTNAQSLNAGNYSVILSNTVGTVTSSNALLTVTAPVTITAQPSGTNVVAGSNVVFSVSAQGDGQLFYQWMFNGFKIVGETNAILTLNNVQVTNSGSYSVAVSNAVSAVTSSSAVLNVLTLPVIVSQPQDASVIAGTDVNFTVTTQEALPLVSSGNLKLWLRADVGVISQNNQVSQWQDQSGGNRHSFQADPNKQPSLVAGAFNGRPVLRFDGIQNTTIGDFLQGTNNLGLTNGFTAFMVYSKVDRGGFIEEVPVLVGVPGVYYSVRGFYFSGSQFAMAGWGNDYYSGFYIPPSTYRIGTERLNINRTQVDFFDAYGTNEVTSSRATSGLLPAGAGYYVGGLDVETRNFQGDIAEIIYYEGSLSEGDRQAVSNYLKQKYYQVMVGFDQAVNFQWQLNGTNIVGATNASFTITNAQPANVGAYSVIVSNLAGSVTSSNASLIVNIPPSINTQPQTQAINAGATATFAVVASGTGPLNYQWQKDGGNLPSGTNASLVLTNLQPTDAAIYRVIVTSPYGTVTSTNAALTVNVSTVRAVSMNAPSATTVVVPIRLVALGNENALGFSLLFDSSILSYAGAAVGSGFSQATLIANTNQLGAGKLGLAIGLSANNTFSAGTQQVINVSFKIAPVTNAQTSTISIGDSPTVRQVSDATAHSLWSSFFGATITISPSDFEGDVSPRPAGDRALTITDWVQVGRFAAGLDTITNASEFQRVDCAPRSSGGNGSISVTDWVQAGRYATGVDPLTPLTGPTGGFSLAKSKPIPAGFGPERVVQIQANSQNGQTNVISVSLVAIGDENAMGFSLSFDAAALTFVSADFGSGASGAFLNVNTNQVSAGKLGFTLALSTGNTFVAGTQQVVTLTFVAEPFANGTTTLTFADSPVLREVSDSGANSLTATYANGSLTLVQSGPVLTITNAVTGIVVSWPASAAGFALETSSSWTNWAGVTNNLHTNGDVITTTLPLIEEQMYYRLKK